MCCSCYAATQHVSQQQQIRIPKIHFMRLKVWHSFAYLSVCLSVNKVWSESVPLDLQNLMKLLFYMTYFKIVFI